MNAPLYRVRYVRVVERIVKTVDQETLRWLQGAGYMGIRVTSYRTANERETLLYRVAKNVAAGRVDTSALTGAALRDAEYVLTFKPGTEWLAGDASGFRPNRERELIDAGVFVKSSKPGVWLVGKRT